LSSPELIFKIIISPVAFEELSSIETFPEISISFSFMSIVFDEPIKLLPSFLILKITGDPSI